MHERDTPLQVACHTPPLKKAEKQGEMPHALTILSPILSFAQSQLTWTRRTGWQKYSF